MAPPIEHELNVAMDGKVILRGYRVLNNGDLLLFWQRPPEAVGAQDDLHFSLQSYALDGTPLAGPVDRRLAGYYYPTPRWAENEVVMGRVPAASWLGSAPQQGTVRFTLRVYDADDPSAKPLPMQDGRDALDIAPVEVIID